MREAADATRAQDDADAAAADLAGEPLQRLALRTPWHDADRALRCEGVLEDGRVTEHHEPVGAFEIRWYLRHAQQHDEASFAHSPNGEHRDVLDGDYFGPRR